MRESFEQLRNDPNGNVIIHGHMAVIDLFDEGYDERINGAKIKEEALKIQLERLDDTVNSDGYGVGQWKMVFKQGYKIGQVFDRIPYGIIDKTITGLGATTLEIYSEVRSSIIVVPTKALAYNKHVTTNKNKGEEYCMYVGSAIGNIKKDTTVQMVEKYLQQRKGDVRKFLVVADSLPMLIDYLSDLGENIFESYFLMVDEIDTMQDDSAYRPKLEVVIDHYFRFKYYHRAAVSATIREFSDPRLNIEARLRIEWERQPSRRISITHTNYVDDITWRIINHFLSLDNEKILVAYNSIDGIMNIIRHLDIPNSQCGILCSERSHSKINSFYDDANNALDYKGALLKRVTFMTCAYFAGIDIMDKCHLISVSSKLQPFTYLSVNKITQIAGRLRNGAITEDIVFDTNAEEQVDFSKDKYKKGLIDRAEKYADFLNVATSAIDGENELLPMKEFLYSYMDFVGKRKPSYSSYPLTIIRQNSINNKFVPAYLNIDALIETRYLKTYLYTNAHTLINSLRQDGHIIEAIENTFCHEEDHDALNIAEIKELNQKRMDFAFDELAKQLIEWHSGDRNEYRLKEIARGCSKRLQDNVVTPFVKYSDYISPIEILDGLRDCYKHNRKLRNFINAVVFHILPFNHPFKAALMAGYKVDIVSQSSSSQFTTKERHILLAQILVAECKLQRPYSKSVLSDMLNSFFDWARSSRGDRVRALNPFGLTSPCHYYPIDTNILEVLVFPR